MTERKRYYSGADCYSKLVGPKPRDDSIVGVCPVCLQACWYSWIEISDDHGIHDEAILSVHVDVLGFIRCKGSSGEPMGLGSSQSGY